MVIFYMFTAELIFEIFVDNPSSSLSILDRAFVIFDSAFDRSSRVVTIWFTNSRKFFKELLNSSKSNFSSLSFVLLTLLRASNLETW